MSYSLAIWEAPIPRSFTEAVRIEQEVSNDFNDRQTNQKFDDLATSLTARYPCNMDPMVESDDEVWSDGPVNGLASGPMWGVGILTQHAAEVVPFVVDQATRLGLVVFDPQMGRAYVGTRVFTHEDSADDASP